MNQSGSPEPHHNTNGFTPKRTRKTHQRDCDLVNVQGIAAQDNSHSMISTMRTQKRKPFFKGITKSGDHLYEAKKTNDHVLGSRNHDRINGKQGDDFIKAKNGHDLVIGGKGDDTLFGGSGNDTLVGGMGSDMLNGGGGADTFYISYGKRTIEDFDFNEGDNLLFGEFITNISYKQDGNNVLVKSDQGITTILNHDVNDFNAYGHP